MRFPRLRLNRRGGRLTIYGRKYNTSFYATWGMQRAKRNQTRLEVEIQEWADIAHLRAVTVWEAMTPEEREKAWEIERKRTGGSIG